MNHFIFPYLFTTPPPYSRQLCRAYCSIAELYLTDLCYEPDAESQCESSLQSALALDDPNATPDALQAMANLRLSQENRRIEAIDLILDAYNRMKVGCEALATLVGLGRTDDVQGDAIPMTSGQGFDTTATAGAIELHGEALEAANSLPGFEFRCQSAKLLLECASLLTEQHRNDIGNTVDDARKKDQCVEASIQVLGSLMAENDEVVEVWYLLGCAFSAGSTPNTDASRYYWETALQMLSALKKEICKDAAMLGVTRDQDDDLNEQLQDLGDKIEDIQQKLSRLNQGINADKEMKNV